MASSLIESKNHYNNIFSTINERKVLYGVDEHALTEAVQEKKIEKEYIKLIDQYEKMPDLIEGTKKAKAIEVARHISKIGSIIGLGLLIVGAGSFFMGGLPLFFIPALVVGAAALIAGIACTVFLFLSRYGFSSKEELAEKICDKMLQEEKITRCYADARIDANDEVSTEVIAQRSNGDEENRLFLTLTLVQEYTKERTILKMQGLREMINPSDLEMEE